MSNANATPWKCDQQCQARACREAQQCTMRDDPPCGHMLRGIRKDHCERCKRAASGDGAPAKPLTDPECWGQGKPDSIDRAMAYDAGVDVPAAADLAEALRLVLPMAKGYAYNTHRIPANVAMVEQAETTLRAHDSGVPLPVAPQPDTRRPWERTDWTCARARIDQDGMHCPEDKCRDCPKRAAGVKVRGVLDQCATCDDTGTTNLGVGPQPCPICKPEAYGVKGDGNG